MSFTELSEAFFMKAAGWEAVKNARSLIAGAKVISSNWTPPLLKGVVQEGASSYRAGLVIKGPVDIDNLCTCRASREAGIICARCLLRSLPARCQPSPAYNWVGVRHSSFRGLLGVHSYYGLYAR
jgi:hypothetical protein